jgi:O-antigen/teichoic acid export membrane protein
MSRTRKFLGGISFGYLSLGVATVVGLWLTPFLLGRVGTHEFGLWLITTQILGYLALLDFGVVALAPRETAYATGRLLRNWAADDVGVTFARFRHVVRWQLVPAALVAAVGWWLVARRWPELQAPLGLIVAAFLITFPLRLYHATLQGLQDLAYLGKVQLAAYLAGTAATVSLVLGGVGLMALAIGWIVTQGLSAAACGWRLRTGFADIWAAAAPAPTAADARALVGRSGWVSLSQAGQVFLSGSDLLVLGAVLGPAATVPYACTGKLIAVLAHQPQLLMQAASPAIAEMRTSASRASLARVALALMRAVLIISGAVACLVLAVNEPFVSWWVGPDQFGGMTLTVLLLAAMLIRHFSTTLVYALFSFGHERRQSLTALADGVVSVAVTAVLASATGLGARSAAVGSLAGVLLVSVPVCSRALARELGISVFALVASVRGWAFRFGLAAALCFGTGRLFGDLGLAGLVLTASAVTVIYAGIMWPLALEAPLGPYVRSAIAWLRGFARMGPRAAMEPRA